MIEKGAMVLNAFGSIAYNEWMKLPERFPNFELDVFQIMPNHMHGIISLKSVGATLAVAPNDNPVVPTDRPVTQNGIFTTNDAIVQNDAVRQNDIITPDDPVARNGPIVQNGTVAQNNIIDQNDAVDQHGAVNRAGDNRAGDNRAGVNPAPTVSDIVGAYKSLVANGCLEICKSKNETMGKLWQRNYYEHIIRDIQSYQRISEYIINNPSKWQHDKFYEP